MAHHAIKQKWAIISCLCRADEEETCSWLFFENNTLGIESENADDNNLKIKASFTMEQVSKGIIDELRYRFEQMGFVDTARSLKTEVLDDQDWLSNWKKYFIPFTVGHSLLICPPWLLNKVSAEQLANRKKIIIDPGMAFGTGLHITTRFCLEAIEKWAKSPDVLDVGTGSGILSIACGLLLPSSHVVALDIDEHAIDNARHNIALNKLDSQIDLIQTSLSEYTHTQFGTLLSNLTAEVIVEFLPAYNKLLKPDGILILAGIIEERLAMLEEALQQYPWQKLAKSAEKGWIGMVLQKTAH